MLPVVVSSAVINDSNPVNMVDTDQDGFQVPGWKSDMDRQIFVSVANLPLGVTMRMDGGLNG